MLTDSSIALRSASPSLLLRVIKFVIARGKPVFPHDEAGFHKVMTGRRLPQDAELHLVSACDIAADFLAGVSAAGLTLGELTLSLRQDLENAFIRAAEHCGVPAERRHFISGDPVRVLAEFAHQHDIDVLVMGRNQSRGLEKLIGSTTEHLLYQASCSILAV